MILFLWNVLLAMIWATATRRFTLANVFIGFVLGYVILWLSRPAIGPSGYYDKVRQTAGLLLFIIWELLRANLRVAYEVVTPTSRRQSGIIAVPLEAQTDLEITILSGLISLTPGTLALDISKDRHYLYVHTLFIGGEEGGEQLKQRIKEKIERRVLELLR